MVIVGQSFCRNHILTPKPNTHTNPCVFVWKKLLLSLLLLEQNNFHYINYVNVPECRILEQLLFESISGYRLPFLLLYTFKEFILLHVASGRKKLSVLSIIFDEENKK